MKLPKFRGAATGGIPPISLYALDLLIVGGGLIRKG